MYKITSKFLIILFFLFIVISCDKEEQCVEYTTAQCACTKQYDPVCGCNGVSYGNACMAECLGIVEYTPGACE